MIRATFFGIIISNDRRCRNKISDFTFETTHVVSIHNTIFIPCFKHFHLNSFQLVYKDLRIFKKLFNTPQGCQLQANEAKRHPPTSSISPFPF